MVWHAGRSTRDSDLHPEKALEPMTTHPAKDNVVSDAQPWNACWCTVSHRSMSMTDSLVHPENA
jgi:hypothetical protein